MKRLPIALAALIAISLPLRAQACTCCGGNSGAAPIGWSASGGSLLVEQLTRYHCRSSSRLEVWRRGQSAPATCFDLYGDPERAIACANATFTEDTSVVARRSARVGSFPLEARALPSRLVRVVAVPIPREGLRPVQLEVQSRGRWLRVWSGDVYIENDYYDGVGSVYFDVWPSPPTRTALLRIQGEIDPARRGHDHPYVRTRWIWITLPDGLGARARTVVRRNPRRLLTVPDWRTNPIVLGARD